MTSLDDVLRGRLAEIQEANLLRSLRVVNSPQQPHAIIRDRAVTNFSSNDYLGLANHPKLKQAAVQAIERFGVGSGASRLICGSLEPHHQLERTIAEFKATEGALVFSTGYATALGAITALISKEDIIVMDKLVHASIVDAARLSGARLRVFAHNDLHDLSGILKWCDRETKNGQILIVTESLFSMDGDCAPLAEIAALKEQHHAWLMVDEAHATGLFGRNRRGLVEQFGVSRAVDIQMGTLGKAIGSAGGFIAGSKWLIDYLVNRARSFIFSTAPPPAASAAAKAGFDIISSPEGEELLETLRTRIDQFSSSFQRPFGNRNSPIVPLIVGEETAALSLAEDLLKKGFYVPAIRYPTVGRGKARLRFTFSAAHSESDLAELLAAMKVLKAEPSFVRESSAL
jgi:8-amino-7-oxononanoate synthase